MALDRVEDGGADDGYVIRPSQSRDRAAVGRELSAYLAHIGEPFDADGLDHDIAHWEREYDGVAGVLLVVEDPAGAIIGTAALRQLEPGVAEIKRMWIRPGNQGRGLGRRLIARCLDEARARGVRAVRLDTESRMERAIHLYRCAGFAEIPDYNGNPRAQLWMERAV